jgi:hypothetical protein
MRGAHGECCFNEPLRYPLRVVESIQATGWEDVLGPLVRLGIDAGYAKEQLSNAHTDAEKLEELASLAVESDACVFLDPSAALPVALFSLVDGLRQAGLAATTQRSVQGEPMLVFEGTRTAAYEIKFDARATVRDVVRTVAYILPRTHQLLIAAGHERDDRLPVIVLSRAAYVSLAAAVGEPVLDRVFIRAGSEPGAAKLQLCDGPLPGVNLSERFLAHAPQPSAADAGGVQADGLDRAIERVCQYDPRVPWPADRSAPPGEDFATLCSLLSAGSSAHAGGGAAALAQLLYRFALATIVGAQCDILTARRNPGLGARVLGRGQVVWSYFIFAALGAESDALRAAKLLDDPWVRSLERAETFARQRAYYDLAVVLSSGNQGSCLLQLVELLPLRERLGWQSPAAIQAATVAHSEPLGQQLTHQPLYHQWPASLYALARHAGALDLLPRDNPFLGRPLELSEVDEGDALVGRLRAQLRVFESLDLTLIPPLLDPLPVIVDVEITRIDGDEVHGHTLLSARDEAEHNVVAPRAGKTMAPGEIWLLEVLSATRQTQEQHLDGLGSVRCTISVPTGQWLQKASV